MNATLLVAHGSRREASNEEVRQMAVQLASYLPLDEVVAVAFLEMGEPNIPATIAAAVAKGATQLTVIPYFLAAGAHVVKDIPAILATASDQFPKVTIKLVPHIGAAALMPQLIADALQSHQENASQLRKPPR
ncbi:MAG: CbiX/SirB N-terminal domain-containing protein [Gammaproteobacteria bacterium]|nr:CbiX/SirB N-terminal domain-containing protein [Gammaproteobacteria bacterium]